MLAPVLLVLAISGSIPTLDVGKSCRGAQAAALPEDRASAVQSCLNDEKVARQQLQAKWRQIPAEARSSCTDEASAFSPSYVELLTCLEMRTGGNFSGAPAAPTDNAPAANGKGSPSQNGQAAAPLPSPTPAPSASAGSSK